MNLAIPPPVTFRPGPLRVLWATLAGNLYLVVGTLACAALALLVALVPPRGDRVYRVARLWARGLLAASGVRLEVASRLGANGPARRVFMANHQSLFDIPVLLLALPGQARFLAKRSLFRIPLFGWALRAGGFVPIDRANRATARESFAAALDRLAEGASLVVFPEAERTLDGRLLPFQRGGFLLALKSGWPIVPVGISGAFEVQMRRSFLVRPRPIGVRLGAPIDVAARSVRELGSLIEAVEARVGELAGVELPRKETPVGVERAPGGAGKDRTA